MARLTRIDQKIFATNASASKVTAFGSIKDGTPVYTKDPAAIQNTNFQAGWDNAVETDYAPYRQDFNALALVVTRQLAYMFQAGIPEWSSTTEYFANYSFVNYGGVLYKAIQDNTNAQPNISIGIWEEAIQVPQSVPAGAVFPFAGALSLPAGYLLCDGSLVSRTGYANLFAAIGTVYGAGDGSTTFKLPDFRGRFLRGYQAGVTANIGVAQSGGAPNITGSFGIPNNTFNPAATVATGALYNQGWQARTSDGNDNVTGGIGFDASLSNSIYGAANEIRPVNYAIQYMIKY